MRNRRSTDGSLSGQRGRRLSQTTAGWRVTRSFLVRQIDITRPLVHQGPFDVIVHKLSDVVVEAERDSQSQRVLADFQVAVAGATCRLTPPTVLLDPLPAMTRTVRSFSAGLQMYLLTVAPPVICCPADWCICSPPYLEIHSAADLPSIHQALVTQGLSFPLICKTRVAHGSLSHEMSLIFGADGLADVRPPCVLQSFVNHGAVLHKVFVVGDQHFCVERPSLKNFPSGPCERKTIFFNSHQVSKPESNSHLTAVSGNSLSVPAVAALVRELRAQLGMALFGVDVIVDVHTHTLTAIDINIFPGYEGVPQFFSSLLSHIQSVSAGPRGADSPESTQTAGGPSAAEAGLEVPSGAPPGTFPKSFLLACKIHLGEIGLH
uniref:Inositol-tetrakisphosphate 1-kinase n=1 Tax=Gasterosteus aculeatus aculeatus TaxID=481459 RepID=A0AAQ4RI78_GASAC